MTLPDIDTLPSVGGALFDYSPQIDPTRDRAAAAANVAYADAVAQTHTIVRAWVRFTLNGAATPVLVAHDSVWGNAIGVAPTFTRTSAGIYTVTWPATVVDEIPNGAPGYQASHTINFRAALGNVRAVATAFDIFCAPTSANVVTVRIFNVAGSAADPGSATDVDVTAW
jgi:hypothetical protein